MPYNALNFTDLAKNAYDMGRDTGKKLGIQNALKQYASDPAATQNALVGLGAFDEADKIGGYRKQQSREQVGAQVASGDMAGARKAALGAGDFDMASHIGQMSAEDVAAAEKRADTFGAVGAKLKSYGYEQRKQALQQLSPWLEQQGFTPDMIAQFDPTDANIDGIIASAMTTKEALAQKKYQLANGGDGYFGSFDPETGTLKDLRQASPDVKTVTIQDAAGNDAVFALDPKTGQPVGAPQGQGADQGSLAQRNNNPGNLRPDGSKWQGMTGEDGGFVQFDTPENGMRAARINLANQAKLHGIDTITGLIAKWAPASDNNDPAAYAQTVAKLTGLDPNAPLDFTDPAVQDKILPAIAQVEGGGSPAPQGQSGGMKPVLAAPGFGSGVDPKQHRQDAKDAKDERTGQIQLRKEFDTLPDVKNYNTVATQYDTIKRVAAKPSAQNDIALIFSYMKMNDPTSVVREGEFATAQNAAGVPDQIRNQYNKALNGQRLNERQRRDFVSSAEDIFAAQDGRYQELVGQYSDYATQYGWNPTEVIKPRKVNKQDAPSSGGTNGYTPEQVAAHQVLKKQDPSWNSAQGFQRIPRTKAEYDRIKPGEHYLDTDGVVKEKR